MRESPDSLQSLDRGLEILQVLAERPYTADELSRKLKLPRGAAYCMLVTLRGRHLVQRHPRQPAAPAGR